MADRAKVTPECPCTMVMSCRICDAVLNSAFKSPPDTVEQEWPVLAAQASKMMLSHLREEHGYADSDLWYMGSPPLTASDAPVPSE